MFPIVLMFFPALFLKETGKQGIVRVSLIFLGVAALMGAYFGPSYGFGILTLFGPLILVLDYCIRTERQVGITILVATLVFLFSVGFNFYMTDLMATLESGNLLKEVLAIQEKSLQRTDLSSLEVDRIISQLREGIIIIQTLLPALILLTSLATVYISFSMTGKYRLMRGEKIIAPPPFLFLRLPKNLVATTFLGSILLLSLSSFIGIDAQTLGYNIAFVVCGLLLFQGMAVVNFLLFRFMPVGVFRAILIGFILILPLGQISLVFIGLLDQWFNFRGLKN